MHKVLCYRIVTLIIGSSSGFLFGTFVEKINKLIIDKLIIDIEFLELVFIEFIFFGLIVALVITPIENQYLFKLKNCMDVNSNAINGIRNKYKFGWASFLFFIFFTIKIQGSEMLFWTK